MEANGSKEQMSKASEAIIGNIGYSSCVDRASVFAFLGCFSCELYLKFIIACDNWDKKKPTVELQYGHELKTLFNSKLSQSRKQMIISQLISTGIVKSDQEFIEQLSACSNGFVTWRYYFESDNSNAENDSMIANKKIVINTSFLVELSNVLSDICAELFEQIDYEFDSDEVPFIELV